MNENALKNVLEYWPLYDTVLIGDNAIIKYPAAGYYADYAALGAPVSIPFFNIRNRSQVGIAYNNFDSKEHLAYPFHCQSMGVEFIAPVASDNGLAPAIQDIIFGKLVMHHCAVTLTVSQDEKLACAVPLCPAGMGIAGGADDAGAANHANYIVAESNNGVSSLTNRWKFPEPIILPRNVTIRATIEFSPYARNVLQTFGTAPSASGPVTETIGDQTSHPTVAAIRLSMFGLREVQQRGELHFR